MITWNEILIHLIFLPIDVAICVTICSWFDRRRHRKLVFREDKNK